MAFIQTNMNDLIVDAYHCEKSFCIKIKVGKIIQEDSNYYFKGIILEIPEENLYKVVGGCEIPKWIFPCSLEQDKFFKGTFKEQCKIIRTKNNQLNLFVEV